MATVQYACTCLRVREHAWAGVCLGRAGRQRAVAARRRARVRVPGDEGLGWKDRKRQAGHPYMRQDTTIGVVNHARNQM